SVWRGPTGADPCLSAAADDGRGPGGCRTGRRAQPQGLPPAGDRVQRLEAPRLAEPVRLAADLVRLAEQPDRRRCRRPAWKEPSRGRNSEVTRRHLAEERPKI